MSDTTDIDQLTASVKEKYGAAALRVSEGDTTSACCGSSGCCGVTTEAWDPITADLYDQGQTAGIPAEALLASLGCGNPTALAQLNRGETVLDLGSGGGIDVLLSARRVGPTGRVYGLDMTDEMLALANENKRKAGAENVEFLKGEIERIPLPDESVDVIISNCVINLSADKRKVLNEAFRVLKPGGRFAVSDVVVKGDVPREVKRNMEMWIGCVAGALEEQEFLDLLTDVGFENPSIEPTRVYRSEDAAAFLAGSGLDAENFARDIDGKFFSGFVRATRPASRSCCGPDCCTPASTRSEGEIEYRRALPSDREAVARLLTSMKLPLDGVPDDLHDFRVAVDRGELIGVAGLEQGGEADVLLRSVAVNPNYRDRGVARALVDSLLDSAANRGAGNIYLLTTTAAEYFGRRGFVRIPRTDVPPELVATAEFQGACPASATVMRLQRAVESA